MSLRGNRDFIRLWTAEGVSLFGSQVTLLAIPLTAVLILHAGAFQMGLLEAAGTAPALLVGPFAGVWVDRLRRRRLMIATDFLRAGLLVTIPIAASLRIVRIEQLYGVVFLAGAGTIVFDLAYGSLLPSLVSRDELVGANSRLQGTEALAGMLGPALGGALVQLLTAPTAILADALSFLVSAGVLTGLHEVGSGEGVSIDGSIWREIAEGWRYVFGSALLRPLTLSSATFNLFDSILMSIYVLYMVRGLHLPPASVGLVFGLGGAGALLGAGMAGRLVTRAGFGTTVVSCVVLAGVAEFAIGLATGPIPARLAMLIAAEGTVEVTATIYRVNSVSLRQAVAPEGLLGRVNATFRVLGTGVIPIGSIAGGLLGATVGLRQAVLIAGAGTLLSFLWIALSPLRRLRTAALQTI